MTSTYIDDSGISALSACRSCDYWTAGPFVGRNRLHAAANAGAEHEADAHPEARQEINAKARARYHARKARARQEAA